MPNIVLAGIAAGLGAALLFAWTATGVVPARTALALLTGLPLAVAAAGWGYLAAAIGSVLAALVLGLGIAPTLAVAFLATQAAPIVFLSYLAGLSRADAGGQLEWYPPGRIVVWAAIIATLLTFAAMLLLGSDMEAIKTAIRGFVETFATRHFPEISGGKTLSAPEIAELAEMALVLLPAAMAISLMGTLLVNIWLGGRIARASGILGRPWPDLSALELPRGVPLVFAVATAGTFLSGIPGLGASALFGALFLAYVLVGLAVIHHVTRGHPWRAFALWGIYGGLVVFNSVAALLIAILGLADAIRPLRQPPPPPAPHGGGPPAPTDT